MNYTDKKLFQYLITYLCICLVECVAVIIVFILIPTDPKNLWLFGLSKSRWLMIMGVVLISVMFIFGLLLLIIKRRKGDFENIVTKFRTFHAHKNLVWLVGFSLVIIFLVILIFHHFLNLQVISIITRLTPLFILIELFIFQTIIFLVASHSLFFVQPFFKGFFDIFFITPGRGFSVFFQIIENQINRFAKKVNRKILVSIILLSPFLMTISLVWFFYNTSISGYLPTGSDEMSYWREILTFTSVGFQGGQYSTDEMPAVVTRFDNHGPAFPVFYGLFGKLFGWELFTGVLFNLIFLTLALLLLIFLSRPTKQQLIFLWLLLITYWPIWLYMPTTRVEGLFYAIAIAMAGLFSKLIDSEKKPVAVSILLVIMILFAGTMRLSWSLLFFSLIGVFIAKYSWQGLLKTTLFAIIPIGFAALYFKYFHAPYPFITHDTIHSLGRGGLNQFIPFIENALENTVHYFSIFNPPIIVLLRYQILWAAIVCMIDFYKTAKSKERSKSMRNKNIDYLNASILGISIVFTITVYTVHGTRDYRLLAPHFLLSLVILIFSSRQRLVLGVIISNLIFSVSFGNTFYWERYSNFLRDNSDIAEIHNAISEYVIYQPVDNHWCNTIDVSRYSNEITWAPWMLFLPDEFGVTSIMHWDKFYRTKLKARFVLLDPEYIRENYPRLFNNTNLEPLTETPIGTFYFNRDSGCPPVE